MLWVCISWSEETSLEIIPLETSLVKELKGYEETEVKNPCRELEGEGWLGESTQWAGEEALQDTAQSRNTAGAHITWTSLAYCVVLWIKLSPL